MRDMQRLQMRQWWEKGGLKVWHWLHMLNLVACKRCSRVGTAAVGTDPGSVKLVLIWDAKENDAKMLYKSAAQTGMPPVRARKLMVRAL